MRKYYLIEIADGDAKIAGKSIYEYTDQTLAIANFHSKLGAAMKSDLFTHEQLMVIDSFNNILASNTFDRPVEPTEE